MASDRRRPGYLVASASALAMLALGSCGQSDDDPMASSGYQPGDEIDAGNYEIAWQVCDAFGIEGTAEDQGLDSTDPVELARSYAEESAAPERQEGFFEGCLAALEGRDPPEMPDR